MPRWSRRRLILAGLAATGGALTVGALRRLDDGDAAAKFGAAAPGEFVLDPWIRLAADGFVTFGIHRAEMGQGIVTALAMLLAEELDVDWERVRYEFTPVDRDYFNFAMLARGQPLGPVEGRPLARLGTSAIRGAFHAIGLSMTISSSSTTDGWDALRPVAAGARALLVETAARRLGVPPGELATAGGAVTHAASGRTLAYAELAAEAARTRRSPTATPRPASAFRIVGRDVPQLDAPAKTDGSARFGCDVRLPGMRYATVVQCPVFGGSLERLEDAQARGMPGVEHVIRLAPGTIAVVARTTWAAFAAADRLRIAWRAPDGPLASSEAIRAAHLAGFDAPDAVVVREPGGSEAAESAAPARRVEGRYSVPYLAHACMEPMNATAMRSEAGLEIWAPTQSNSIARAEAARATGLAPEVVQVHSTLLGGGFGRRAEADFVVQAALLAARLPGVPVQVLWRRSEDLQHDAYRPAAAGRLRATLAADGTVASIDCTVVAQSTVGSYESRTPTPRGGDARRDKTIASGLHDAPYALPRLAVRYVPRELPVPVGYWRSVTHSCTCFFLESFLDELAEARGEDPLALRRGLLAHEPRALRVLEEAALRGRWSEALPPGRGRGLAFTANHATFAAHVVEVRLAAPGEVEILGVTSVMDCGRIVRPGTVRAQVEGCVCDGLWSAVSEARIEQGRATARNFDDYPLLRITDLPPVDVHLVPSQERPGGVGEAALPAVAPALCNAIRRAGGPRVRELPLARAGLVLRAVRR